MTVAALQAPPEPPPAASDPLEYVSASRLKCWQECRLKFYYRYVERIPTTTSPALFVGQIVHTVLQHWNLRRWRGEKADATALWPVFTDHWSQQPESGIEWNDKESYHKEKAWNMLEFYLQHTPVPLDEKPEAVEVMVERDFVAAGLPPLKGIIDLVREGGRIVDFKTTARTPDAAQAQHLNELQMSCYCVLYREATGHKESGVELHHLVKTKQPKLVVTPLAPMSADQGRRLMAAMRSYVGGVAAGDFVPSPGLHCSYCDFFGQCRNWKGGAE
ncbi:MAG: PD-(D/E)XK nuclease family protein [Verrucomicrobiota bacterium]